MPCWNSLCLGFAPALICRIHIAGLLLKGARNSIRMCVLIQGDVCNYSGVADSETLQTGMLNRLCDYLVQTPVRAGLWLALDQVPGATGWS